MAKTAAQRQAEYRRRQTERFERMQTALRRILAELESTASAKGVLVREIAEEGLR